MTSTRPKVPIGLSPLNKGTQQEAKDNGSQVHQG